MNASTNKSAQSTETPRLTATEQKLLQQVQSQARPQASLIRFLSNSACGFYY